MGLSADSRYADPKNPVKYYDVDTRELYLGLRQPISLPVAEDDQYERPNPGERGDQFAYRMWGAQLGERATRYRFVLYDLNGVVNPFKGLDPLKRYRVPSADRVVLEVLP